MPQFNWRSPIYNCIIKLTYHDKHEPLSIQIFRMETSCSNNRPLSHCVLVNCIRTHIYRKLIRLPMNNCVIPVSFLSPTNKTLNPNLSAISDNVNDKQCKATVKFTHSARNSLLQDEGSWQSLARPTSQCRRMELIVSSERAVCSFAEL